MQSLESLVDVIFSGQPNDELTQQAKTETLNNMQQAYNLNLPQSDAQLAVLLQCLAPQYAKSCRNSIRVQRHKDKFFRRYPYMLRGGLLSILILPLVFLALMFSLESKILFLTLWVTSIILISGFLITIEYIKDHFLRMDQPTTTSQEEVHS